MSARSDLCSIAKDAGVPERMLRERMEDKGLLSPFGTPTRMAHLTGCVVVLEDGPRWDLAALAATSAEDFDPAPPKGGGARTVDDDVMSLHGDEKALLASGWNFVHGRDAFENTLLEALSGVVRESLIEARWNGSALHARSISGRTLVPGMIDGDQLLLDVGSATTQQDGTPPCRATGSGDASPEPLPSLAIEPATVEQDGEAIAIDDGRPDDHEGDASSGEIHGTRAAAWSAAMAEAARRGMTATALAYASSLRMNEGVRAALLRGAAPTDHVLGAICSTLGIRLSFELSPKGTRADPDHYRHPDEDVRDDATAEEPPVEAEGSTDADDDVRTSAGTRDGDVGSDPETEVARLGTDEFSSVWAETLRRRREDQRTDTAVATACGARRNGLREIMRGNVPPTPSVLLRLALLYRVDHDLDLDPRGINGGLRLVDGRVVDVGKEARPNDDRSLERSSDASVPRETAACEPPMSPEVDAPLKEVDLAGMITGALKARGDLDQAREEADLLKRDLCLMKARADSAEAEVIRARTLMRQVSAVLGRAA